MTGAGPFELRILVKRWYHRGCCLDQMFLLVLFGIPGSFGFLIVGILRQRLHCETFSLPASAQSNGVTVSAV